MMPEAAFLLPQREESLDSDVTADVVPLDGRKDIFDFLPPSVMTVIHFDLVVQRLNPTLTLSDPLLRVWIIWSNSRI